MDGLRNIRWLAVIAVLATALVAAGCGDDDEGEATAGGGDQATQSSQQLRLTGEDTTLVLDSGTAMVLEENKVEVAPVDPAGPGGDGIAFPITGGEVDAESLAGTIEHSGGLAFSAGETTVELTDFVVDTRAGTLTATVGQGQVPILSLDLSGLERTMEGGAIVASGISATLTAEAAQALNDAFGVSIFEEGLAIGDVTVRAVA
jgi:Htaa